jgi:Retroviral aspartyl protease
MMKYDKSFDPPAPVAEISLRNTETGERRGNVFVLLDTGADVSLLPLSAIEKLQIEPSGEKVNLLGFDESRSASDAYTLQIIFLGKRLTGDFCAINNEIGILGRDVLNEFSIIFDGNNLEWKEQK